MRCLLDTNIALRYVDTDDSQHAVVTQAVDKLIERGDEIVVVPHVLYEFWVVATRPVKVNGLEWSTDVAQDVVDSLLKRWLFFPDTPDIFTFWYELVTRHNVSGRPAHDARLAAAVQAHKLDALLTLNGGDFKRYGLNVITPADC